MIWPIQGTAKSFFRKKFVYITLANTFKILKKIAKFFHLNISTSGGVKNGISFRTKVLSQNLRVKKT